MRHLGLFEGIGGFSLAARMVGWQTVAWCEIDTFCQKVLTKHFPEAKRHGDIKELDGTQYRGTVDIITGGFPCQPYSSAGKRRGTDDERHLWPEMLRVIGEVAPRWVVGENVYGLVNWNGGLVFEQVQVDMENLGYEVTAYILPAAGVNAPHQRYRVWFVAHHKGHGSLSGKYESGAKETFSITPNSFEGASNGLITDTDLFNGRGGEEQKEQKREEVGISGSISITNADGNDAWGRGYGETGCETGKIEGAKKERKRIRTIAKRVGKKRDATNTDFIGSQGGKEKEKGEKSVIGNHWSQFPTKPGICGGDDGVPNRVDRVKALGNAIVPQVAVQIFKAINEYESLKS